MTPCLSLIAFSSKNEKHFQISGFLVNIIFQLSTSTFEFTLTSLFTFIRWQWLTNYRCAQMGPRCSVARRTFRLDGRRPSTSRRIAFRALLLSDLNKNSTNVLRRLQMSCKGSLEYTKYPNFWSTEKRPLKLFLLELGSF